MSYPTDTDIYSQMRNSRWSETEKAIARKAFDAALTHELDEVTARAQRMAPQIKELADLWKLEAYLTRRRHEIDRRYDYRYSILPLVFADLIRKGRLREEDLAGLREDKIEYVRRFLGTLEIYNSPHTSSSEAPAAASKSAPSTQTQRAS
jgi:hypothetical protein